MKIFLDDERWPVLIRDYGYEPNIDVWRHDTIDGHDIWVADQTDIVVCRIVESAMKVLETYRDKITEIMFDNDLGTELEGKDFAKQLIEWDMDQSEAGKPGLNDDLVVTVHSRNVAASGYIRDLMGQYLQQR